MLKELSLTNFKSWKHIEKMELAPITGLFGANSSGKTSILQFLLLLKQTVESPDRNLPLHTGDENSYVDLGGVGELMHQHDRVDSLDFSIHWDLLHPLEITDPENHSKTLLSANQLDFSCSLMQNSKGQFFVEWFVYRTNDFRAEIYRIGTNKYRLEPKASPTIKFTRTQGRKWELPAPGKCFGFPDQINYYYANAAFLSSFELELTTLFKDRVYYLGPLREHPKRQYPWSGSQPKDMGQRGERFVEAILTARERGLKINPGFKKRKINFETYIAQWLQKLGLIYSFKVEPMTKGGNLYQVKVKKNPHSADVLITDVGFGVSQILPVIALCYYVPEGSIILLEQPEIHLHPSVQAGLADVFIDAVKTRKVQIIVESHSEHLLRRLQRKIAEEEITSDKARLYFCKMENGASELEPLRMDEFGRIENWPKDFFGDEFGEMAATTEAIIRRQEKAEE